MIVDLKHKVLKTERKQKSPPFPHRNALIIFLFSKLSYEVVEKLALKSIQHQFLFVILNITIFILILYQGSFYYQNPCPRIRSINFILLWEHSNFILMQK